MTLFWCIVVRYYKLLYGLKYVLQT